ncbi:MAG: patatin family protein [Anaerolineaceae bacterium]|nr:patatin family protein [Anaerolineaceae bacterium]
MKTALIDVGGAQRGIYAAGVIDRFMDDGVTFDLGIGVSAGSANIASFISLQKRRNYMFYTVYSRRDEYMSRQNIRKKGCFLDVAYIYGTLSNSDGENPLDYQKFVDNPMEFLAVATEMDSGAVKYFWKQDLRMDYYNVLMASSAMPYVCTPQEVNGTLYFDGSVSDPIPLKKAFSEGCDKVVLILNQPKNMLWSAEEDAHLASRIQNKYPQIAQALLKRAEKYNQGVALAESLSEIGKVKIIAPDDICGIKPLSQDIPSLEALYAKGFHDGAGIIDFLEKAYSR